MYKPTLALCLLASAVAAEYTTTLLLLEFDDSQPLVGSVIATDATATTYSVTCPAYLGDSCGIPPSFTITQGPSTMRYNFPTGGAGGSSGEMTAGCEITTDHGVCSGSIFMTGGSGGSGGSTISSYSNYGTDDGAQAVTITAGANPGTTGSSSSIALTSATTTGTLAGQTTGSSSSGSTTSSGSSSAAGKTDSSGSSKVSTGGVPMVTGHAQWVIGGAAAAVAMAAM